MGRAFFGGVGVKGHNYECIAVYTSVYVCNHMQELPCSNCCCFLFNLFFLVSTTSCCCLAGRTGSGFPPGQWTVPGSAREASDEGICRHGAVSASGRTELSHFPAVLMLLCVPLELVPCRSSLSLP